MDKAYLTDWVDVADANELIKKMIDNGTYKKFQIKKSSNKFKNGKDKKDGYVTRVEVIPGVHPELEVEIKYRGKKTKAVNTSAKKEAGEAGFEGGLKIDGKTYRTVDTVMDLENNEYNFFCTDGKHFYVAKKKNMAGAQAVIAEGPMTEEANRKLWQAASEQHDNFRNADRVMQPVQKKVLQSVPRVERKATAAKAKQPAKKAAAKAAKPKAKIVAGKKQPAKKAAKRK